MPEYFVDKGGVQTGPFELQQLGSEPGRCTAATLVWRSGLTEWVPASSLRELESVLPDEPPPYRPGTARTRVAADRRSVPISSSVFAYAVAVRPSLWLLQRVLNVADLCTETKRDAVYGGMVVFGAWALLTAPMVGLMIAGAVRVRLGRARQGRLLRLAFTSALLLDLFAGGVMLFAVGYDLARQQNEPHDSMVTTVSIAAAAVWIGTTAADYAFRARAGRSK